MKGTVKSTSAKRKQQKTKAQPRAKKTKTSPDASASAAAAVEDVRCVSLVTITEPHRYEFLKLLAKSIQLQTKQEWILEWVIVVYNPVNGPMQANPRTKDMEPIPWEPIEGPTEEPSELGLASLSGLGPEQIQIMTANANDTIASCRNMYNKHAKGTFIVVMDDDVLYPPSRVEHAVQKLRVEVNKKKENEASWIVGCASYAMYDYQLDRWVQCHAASRSACMVPAFSQAYHRNYLNHYHNMFNDCDHFGEETAFTSSVIPLSVFSSGFRLSHGWSRVSMRERLAIDPNIHFIRNAPQPSQTPLWQEYMQVMTKTFPSEEQEERSADLSIYCGYHMNLADEQFSVHDEAFLALQELVRVWAERDQKKVVIYGDFSFHGIRKSDNHNVTYCHMDFFHVRSLQTETLVIWGFSGMHAILPLLHSGHMAGHTNKIVLNLFDDKISLRVTEQAMEQIHCIVTKSHHHAQSMYAQLRKFSSMTPDKFLIVEGAGGRSDDGATTTAAAGNSHPYRFVFTGKMGMNSDTEMLVPILQFVWPTIKRLLPMAELHCYFTNMTDPALSPPGVMFHGTGHNITMDHLLYALRMSSWFLCPTANSSEMDAMLLKYAWKQGCMPLVLHQHVYKERPGIHFTQYSEIDSITGPLIAGQMAYVVQHWQRENYCPTAVEVPLFDYIKLVQPPVPTWEEVATQWLENVLLCRCSS